MPKLRFYWWGGWVPRNIYFRHPFQKSAVRHYSVVPITKRYCLLVFKIIIKSVSLNKGINIIFLMKTEILNHLFYL
jgi:hypothetical protein